MADRRERARRARRRQESLTAAPAGSTFRAAAARDAYGRAALGQAVSGRAKPLQSPVDPTQLSAFDKLRSAYLAEQRAGTRQQNAIDTLIDGIRVPQHVAAKGATERKREIPPPAISGLRIAEVRQCKARPNPRRDGARGGGTGRPFVPWCR